MIDLHFICPQGLNHKQLGQRTFESGNWTVKDPRAIEAVGGRIYLHETQIAPAWHGGTIRDWRVFQGDRKVFLYEVDGDYAIVCPGGWGQEQATVRR